MSQLSKEDRLAKIHADALIEFNEIQGAVRDQRLQCLEARRFYSIPGAQWEGALGEQFVNKFKPEVNKVHLSVIRIFNEYLNNTASVFFEAPDDEDSEFAERCTGLHRQDEKESSAEEAYDNAFEEAVGGGMGAWRLRAAYEDDEDENDEFQHPVFEPIYDADISVFFDLNAKRQDKSDAKSCYVLTSMSRRAYEEEYDDDPSDWPSEITLDFFDWAVGDDVKIAELYKIEEKKDSVIVFKGVTDDEKKYKLSELKADPSIEAELQATGYQKVREKKIKTKKVHKYIMSGGSILEDCGYIAGKYIPIIPVYGKRWFVDGIERCMGHVQLAMDTQRLKNMQLSQLGTLSAASSIEKPILFAEQVKGFETEWSRDAVENYAYLRVNMVRDANGNPLPAQPVAYTKAPSIHPAMAALLQITDQDIQDLLGNQQAGEELQPNTSGLAVELVQNKLDMQSYIYISGMGKAKKWSGKVWLSMAKDLFVEKGRKLKALNEQGKVNKIELLKPTTDKNGKIVNENDFSTANFEVTSEIGPTSGSKRRSIVKALTGVMNITQDPETLQVLGSVVMMNMEGEGISDVRDYYRAKLVKMGVIKPTPQEAAALQQEQQNQAPDPNAEYLKAAAIAATADASKKQADAELSKAKADKTRVEIIEMAHGGDITGHTQQLNAKKHNLDVAKTAIDANLSNTTSQQQ